MNIFSNRKTKIKLILPRYCTLGINPKFLLGIMFFMSKINKNEGRENKKLIACLT